MFRILSIAALSLGLATCAMAADTTTTGIRNGATPLDRTTTGSVNNATGMNLDRPVNTPTYKVNPSLNRMNCTGAYISSNTVQATRGAVTVPAGSSCR